jgi:cytochrome c biogenesis protein CcmG, thiol:disulfide interchange protein DsbE
MMLTLSDAIVRGRVVCMIGRMRSQRARWVQYGFAVLGTALLVFALVHEPRRSGGLKPVAARREMPELALEQLGGGTWRMADHHGQVVLVNYWASWCVPCWKETPGLIRLSRELGPRGLTVVGIAMDEGGRDKVRGFVERFQVPYPVAFPEAMSQMVYGMEGLPTTILVDRGGRVAKTYVGAVSERDFQIDVEALLAER